MSDLSPAERLAARTAELKRNTELLAEDQAKLDAAPLGEIVEASGRRFVLSSFKGKRHLIPMPRTLNFKQRQKMIAAAKASGQ